MARQHICHCERLLDSGDGTLDRKACRDLIAAINLLAERAEGKLTQVRQQLATKEIAQAGQEELCNQRVNSAEDALIDRLTTFLESHGVDTSNWDGDDDPAEIVGRGILAAMEKQLANFQRGVAHALDGDADLVASLEEQLAAATAEIARLKDSLEAVVKTSAPCLPRPARRIQKRNN